MPSVPSLKSLSKLGALRSGGFGGGLGARNGVFVRGAAPLIAKFNMMSKIAPIKALDGMTRALLIIEAEAVRLVSRGYYAPAVDTGLLRRSITHQITNFSPNVVEGVVGLNLSYAIYVHEGTIFMEMRPFLVDALKNKQVQVQAILVDAFKHGLI